MPLMRLPSTTCGGYFWFLGWRRIKVVLLEEDPLEGRLVRLRETDEAVVAVLDVYCRREHHDVMLFEPRLHRIAHHANGKSVRVVYVGAANVIVGDAYGVVQIVEISRIARLDPVYNRDLTTGRYRLVVLLDLQLPFREEPLDLGGGSSSCPQDPCPTHAISGFSEWTASHSSRMSEGSPSTWPRVRAACPF